MSKKDKKINVPVTEEPVHLEIPEDENSDTIGGYICSAMGRIPEQGETFIEPNLFRAEIVSADKRKILKLRIYVLDEEAE